MSLAAGQSLSFYEILGPLGAGGMGEVYRARDTRLDREVAIKVLPEELADDEERLRRFEREAKTLAALNHPNVAGIHGVDQVGDVCFLALELVPGEDLATRLDRGPLPIEEALDVARQVAEGLEAAHEAGVVHRDLKPANVRLTPDGTAKVLDFGLAKTTARSGTTAESAVRTQEGLVLGTPTYMAPEQARGRPIDRRVDLWALGCVLYECLSGRRAFDGATVGDVIGAVLEGEPDGSALPERTPRRVRELIERCLVKDPRNRLRDAGDARLELERALAERAWIGRPAAAGEAGRRPWWGALVLVLGALVVAGLAREALRDEPPARRLSLSFDTGVPHPFTNPRIAPDASCVVYEGRLPAAEGETPVRALFRRDLAAFEGVPLAGAEHPITFCFSPDGTELAVLVDLYGRGGAPTLMRLPVRGEAPAMRIGAWPRQHTGGIVWLPDGRVVGAAEADQLILYDLVEGDLETRRIERAFERIGSNVDVFRPLDGRHVLARSRYYEERGYFTAVVAVDVETGEESIVERLGSYGAVLGGERLLFTRGDTLFVAPFDAGRMATDGPATPVADGLRTPDSWRAAWFDVAADGTLIWLPGGRRGTRRHLAVMDRGGELAPFWPEPMTYDGSLRASPDGSFFTALVVSGDGLRVELWGSRADRPDVRRYLAGPEGDYLSGLPLSGGREIVYRRVSEVEPDGIFRGPLAGPGEHTRLIPSDPDGPDLIPAAVDPEERFLVVGRQGDEGWAFSTVPLPSADVAELEPLVTTSGDGFWPKLSPDGRFLAYVDDRLERARLLVRALDGRRPTGPAFPVPTPDGELPWEFAWSTEPDGRIGFLMVGHDGSSVYAVALEDPATGRFGDPRPVGAVPEARVLDTAALSGGRLLLCLEDPAGDSDRVNVVVGALDAD